MAGRLDGRAAVITGSTSGIGRATAELFAREGARVVVNGRRKELGEEVTEGIRQAGGAATFFHGDVSKAAEIEALMQHAVAAYGRLDILVNNAYSGRGGSVVEIAEADWDISVATSLKAVYLGCKYAIPEMLKGGGGAIINMSSLHGLFAAKRAAVYEAVKAGIINLTRQIAVEYGRQGIRANSICPGLVITEKSRERYTGEALRREEEVYPLGRIGQPIDIARAALFLASDESSWITGIALVVDGGQSVQLQETVLYHAERVLRERGGHF